MDPVELEGLLQSMRLTMVNNYASTGFLMILLWDMVITMGDEIEYIWMQKGQSLGKWLFFLNRYIPPLDLIILINTYTNPSLDQRVCIPWFKIDNWMSVFSLAVVDLILLLRTYALWNRSRRVLYFLIGVFVFCTLATSGAITYFTLGVFAVPGTPTEIRPCVNAFKQVNVVEAVWGSTILFDSTVVILTIAKLIPYFQENVTTDLFRIMYQDGFMYFGVLFCISVSNLFVFALAPPDLKLTLVTLQRSMFSLLASRLALNLRGVLTRRTVLDSSVSMPDEFAAELSSIHAVPGVSSSRSQRLNIATPPKRKRTMSSAPSSPKRNARDSFGYPSPYAFDDYDLTTVDFEESPADESPQTPWNTPWNPFRIEDPKAATDGETKADENASEHTLAPSHNPDVQIAGEESHVGDGPQDEETGIAR
ncbi:hypothetical protein EXIGLDRAFT_832610 [Exidia glandulosa HHB12029]|uniref:DUF6533 domain-containing protein n=1 Tax=Exidia glandulosa HHB12029 TaxID=1314781 RepID=A0A165LHX3_EXIGL|nr:hypothetical protein EXIGLDRAFT_832610 [Exidia glandulosa HHB12029]